MRDVFDDFDTQLQCEEFYTDEAGVCEVDEETSCIGCGACTGECYEDELDVDMLDDELLDEEFDY